MPKIKFIYEQTWIDDEVTFHAKRTLIREVSADMYFAILKGFPFEYKCGRIELSFREDALELETGHFDKKLQMRVIPNCIRVLKKRDADEPTLFDFLNDEQALEEKEAEKLRERERQEALDELYKFDPDNEPWWNR